VYVRVIGLSEFAPAARLGQGNGVKCRVDIAKSNRVLFSLCTRGKAAKGYFYLAASIGGRRYYHHLGHVVAAPEAAGLVETLESGILAHASTISTHARGTAAWTRDTLTLRRCFESAKTSIAVPPNPSRGQKFRSNAKLGR